MDYLDEGDNCPNCKGKSSLIYVPDGECSCNHPPYNPPCWPCTNSLVQCSECGWTVGDDYFETGENIMKIQEVVGRLEDKTAIKINAERAHALLFNNLGYEAKIVVSNVELYIDRDVAKHILKDIIEKSDSEIEELDSIVNSVNKLLMGGEK